MKFLSFLIDMVILQLVLPLYVVIFDPRADFSIFNVIIRFMGCSFTLLGEEELIQPSPDRRVMYLANHRSWADFVMDRALTRFQAYFLARRLVALGVPLCIMLGYLGRAPGLGAVCFFRRPKRGERLDRGAFFTKVLDKFQQTSLLNGIIVYPEGTRQTGTEPLVFKDGLVEYAYKRRITVQIMISSGKEFVINEKEFYTTHNQEICTAFSKPVVPSEFESYEEFRTKVKDTWMETWKVTYSEEGVTPQRRSWYPHLNDAVRIPLQGPFQTFRRLFFLFCFLAAIFLMFTWSHLMT
mmetsp:Transcript_35906/g.49833  ORF Transcript_35906/g.49833 Transcript_35906/m.49833 type:complete len:296 (-) Transcript_35906:120-1007(-)